MANFIELPVFEPNAKEYIYMPVNIEQVAYVREISKDKCLLYFSNEEYINVDIDIEEIKKAINCTEKIESAEDMI